MKKIKVEKTQIKKNRWPLKIGLITLVLAAVFTLLSEATASVTGLVVTINLLLVLLLVSIVTDGIGVAVTTAELSSVKCPESCGCQTHKTAQWLIKNKEKVNNICADVIGDICGIVSGAGAGAIVLAITQNTSITELSFWATVLVTSILASLTVGGKAYMKSLAVKNAPEVVMLTARVIRRFVIR